MRHIRFIMTALAVGCGCPAPSFAQSGQAGLAAAMEQRSAAVCRLLPPGLVIEQQCRHRAGAPARCAPGPLLWPCP